MNQVNQYAQSKRYKTKSHPRLSGKQVTLHSVQGTVKLTKPVEERQVEAEALWTFKIAEDYSRQVIQKDICGLPSTKYLMGLTKALYMLRHRHGPVVRKELVKYINTSKKLCTLLLDETTTKQVVKQMDFLIPHWSNSKSQVVKMYLDSKFFVHDNGENLL